MVNDTCFNNCCFLWFLILGGFLGLLALTLMIFTNSNNKKIFDLRISELTIINERSLTVGVYMLTIGTFLGGIWANESWGRYWGWDLKKRGWLVVYFSLLHITHEIYSSKIEK